MKETKLTDVIVHPKFDEFCKLSEKIVSDMANQGFDPNMVADGLNHFGLKIAAQNAWADICFSGGLENG